MNIQFFIRIVVKFKDPSPSIKTAEFDLLHKP